MIVTLAYRPPLAWGALLDYSRLRATAGIDDVLDGSLRRALAIGSRAVTVAVTPAAQGPELALTISGARDGDVPTIVATARRVLDLDADPAAIDAHLARDPRLAPLVRARPGLRIPKAWDAFELIVRAILGQQVSVKGATTLAGRLVRTFGKPLDQPNGMLTHLFPEPSAIAEAPLESIGLTRARAATLRGLGAAVASRALDLSPARDRDEVLADLLALPGIGPWTVDYVRMRAFADPDGFPAGDLGLRRALARDGVLPSQRALREASAAWSPWRAYAAMHLWTGDHAKQSAA